MRMRPIRLLSQLGLMTGIVACCVPHDAGAIPAGRASIEWWTENKRHIGIVRVGLPQGRQPSEDSGRGVSSVPGRVVQVLKGKPPRDVTIDCWNGVRVRSGLERDVLVFFSDELGVEYAISLDDSEGCVTSPAITKDFRVLHARDEILGAVTHRLSRMEREDRGAPVTERERADRSRYLVLEVPGDSEAWDAVNAGSVVFLTVPADREYQENWFRDLGSPVAARRASAAFSLGQFPGRETIRKLRPLLGDTAVDTLAVTTAEGRQSLERFRPVACAACLSLKRMGAVRDCLATCPRQAIWAPRLVLGND